MNEQIRFINEMIRFLDERNLYWDKDCVEEVIEILKKDKKRIRREVMNGGYQVL